MSRKQFHEIAEALQIDGVNIIQLIYHLFLARNA